MGKEWDTFKPETVRKGVKRSSRKSTAVNPKNPSAREKGSPAMEAARYDHSISGAQRFREWLTEIGVEMLRVLKPGAFAFICIGARQDSVAAAITAMTDAGFKTDFTSLYWTYASGFPKAGNIGKMVDKRKDWKSARKFGEKLKKRREELGLTKRQAYDTCNFPAKTFGGNSWFENGRIPSPKDYKLLKFGFNLDNSFDTAFQEVEREVIAHEKNWGTKGDTPISAYGEFDVTKGKSNLEGSYAGYQPKPAVEVILVCMKPLSEKTYVDQALKNRKGITWLDSCRVPTEENLNGGAYSGGERSEGDWKDGSGFKNDKLEKFEQPQGRFPANLLVSDDVLNDGKDRPLAGNKKNKVNNKAIFGNAKGTNLRNTYGTVDSYSRYFDLDSWANTLPFLICPKASKREKNAGCEELEEKSKEIIRQNKTNPENSLKTGSGKVRTTMFKNHHPTVKPLKLMSYLIQLGSREGDVILDPFMGSGTTGVAAKNLRRDFIGIELSEEYMEIAKARLGAVNDTLL